jgi:hypothetical protein
MKQDLYNNIADEMDKVLNSAESKQLFSSSSMLEKLAFKKVSEEDQVSEVEIELDPSLKKTASVKTANPVRDSFNALLKISEDLDNAGFERLAAASILLADKLVSEAKAKSSKKSDKKSDKKSKEEKTKGKKMDVKERMKKMREMQKGKGKGKSKKEDEKKRSKKKSS